MPKKATAIDQRALLATKERTPVVTGSLQRGQTRTETLVDLNFKVSDDFRHEFKQLALDARMKNIELLAELVRMWKSQLAGSEKATGKRGR